MSNLHVDLTDIGDAKVGDRVYFLNGQRGQSSISSGVRLEEFAGLCKMLPAEIMVGIGRSNERIYRSEAISSKAAQYFSGSLKAQRGKQVFPGDLVPAHFSREGTPRLDKRNSYFVGAGESVHNEVRHGTGHARFNPSRTSREMFFRFSMVASGRAAR